MRFNILILLFFTVLCGCGKDLEEPYVHPFIHIMEKESSSVTVNSEAAYTATYSVYLSSALLADKLIVEYEIIPGAGLKAGVDYELVTSSTKLTFLPGIYDMPVRIKWLPNPVDPTKDNTLRIRLVQNSMNFTMGLPGPDGLQREFKITKIN